MSYAGNNKLPCNSCCCYNNRFCILRIVVHLPAIKNRELLLPVRGSGITLSIQIKSSRFLASACFLCMDYACKKLPDFEQGKNKLTLLYYYFLYFKIKYSFYCCVLIIYYCCNF
jgi:hypothetical protein